MKNKNKKIIIIILISLITIMIFYSKNSKNLMNKKDDVEIKKIGVIFNEAGLGDKSFNDLCYEGLLEAQEKLGIEFDYYEVKDKDEYFNIYSNCAKSEKFDLLIALGEEQEEVIKKVSKEYPNQKISIIDSKLDLPNVSSIYTNWSEQTFLNGVMAGLCITNDESLGDELIAGIIIGKDLKYLNEGAIGFEAGLKYINPDIKVVKASVGDFSNPGKAKEIALLMQKKGVKYIQQLAGESGFGVFAWAKEMDGYVFGVDANQNSYEPDHIISTATRHANKIIYNEIDLLVNDKWTRGIKELGLKDNIVGYDRQGSNVNISDEIIRKVESTKQLILEDKIKIPSNYEELEKMYK